jgi:hypothetical protein
VARHRSEEYERARLGQARASGLETKGKGVEVRCYCGSGCSVSLVHKWQYSITLPVYCYHCIAIVLYHNVFHTLHTWLFDSDVLFERANAVYLQVGVVSRTIHVTATVGTPMNSLRLRPLTEVQTSTTDAYTKKEFSVLVHSGRGAPRICARSATATTLVRTLAPAASAQTQSTHLRCCCDVLVRNLCNFVSLGGVCFDLCVISEYKKRPHLQKVTGTYVALSQP